MPPNRPRLHLTPADSWTVSAVVSRLLVHACRSLSLSRHIGSVSVLAALLVLMLGVLSVSPVLHEHCHANNTHHEADCDHHCVVTDFAAGNAWFTPPALLNEPARIVVDVQLAAPADLAPGPNGYRLLPACGPPA